MDISHLEQRKPYHPTEYQRKVQKHTVHQCVLLEVEYISSQQRIRIVLRLRAFAYSSYGYVASV
eukprot:1330852-Amorphochlora_amoeboformis.AAC.1